MNRLITALFVFVVSSSATAELIVVDTGQFTPAIRADQGVDCFQYLSDANLTLEITMTKDPTKRQGSLEFRNSPFIDVTFDPSVFLGVTQDRFQITLGDLRYEENDNPSNFLEIEFFGKGPGVPKLRFESHFNGCSFASDPQVFTSGFMPYEATIYQPGDSSLDGKFDSSDLVSVFIAGKYIKDDDAHWTEGDWNGDGLFDTNDLVTAFQTGGYDAAATPVPEPSYIVIWSQIGLIGFGTVRRRLRELENAA